MIQELRQHSRGYTILSLGILLFVLGYIHFWPNQLQQRIVALAFGIFYFFWGVLVHKNAGLVSTHIIFEYLSMGTLISALLILLTL